MRWIRCMIFVSVLLVAFTLNGEWSINHNAVLICGDTPALEGAGPKNFYIEGRESYDMFWNDTYLMWELMWLKAKFNLHGSAPDSDRIHVLYGYGDDWDNAGFRYNPVQQFPLQGIDYITDYPACYEDVENIFTWLVYGNPEQGIEQMTYEDNLFVWTFDHGAFGNSLRIIDPSNPSNPENLGNYYFWAEQWEVVRHSVVYNNYAYIAAAESGLIIVDISDPAEPVFEGRFLFPDPVTVRDVNVREVGSETYAYILDSYGLSIINVTTPSLPSFVSSCETPGSPLGLYILGDSAYLACGSNEGLCVIDISYPYSPQITGSCSGFSGEDLFVVGDYAYVTARSDGLYIIKVIGVADPEITGQYNSSGQSHGVFVQSDLAYVADFNNGLLIIDVSDPYHPDSIGQYEVGGRDRAIGATDVFVKEDTAYVAYGGYGLRIVEVSDPTMPYEVGSFEVPPFHTEVGVFMSDGMLYLSGSGSDEQTYLCLIDHQIADYDFANYVDQINCNKRIFWMQQCFSGGFIDDFEGPNSVILTASEFYQLAEPADDNSIYGSPFPENESYENVTYTHGEFNFHTMNCVREKTIYPYNEPEDVLSDANQDLLVSMEETFVLSNLWNSTPSTFLYSDIGDIGSETFLGWDDYEAPDEPANLHCVGMHPMGIPGFSFIDLEWQANIETDLVGYRIYRMKEGEQWSFRGSTKTAEYEDDYCSWGTTYYYYITAVDVANNVSGASNVIQVDVGWWPVHRMPVRGGGNGQELVQDKNGVMHFVFNDGDSIFYTSTSDSGEFWSEPFAIGCGKGPSLDIGKDGSIIHAVWVMNDNVGEYIKYARYNGTKWDKPVALYQTPGTCYWGIGAPSIDVGNSLCYVVWESRVGENHPLQGNPIIDIIHTDGLSLFSGYFPTEETAPELFIEKVDFLPEVLEESLTIIRECVKSPSLVLDNTHIVHILWEGLNDMIRFYTASDTDWQKEEFSTICSVKDANLSFHQRLLHFSWAEENIPHSEVYGIKYANRYPGMKSFVTEPVSVSDVSFNSLSPHFSSNHLVWSQKSGEVFDIFKAKFEKFEWSEPVNSSEVEWANSKYPRLFYAEPNLYKIWTEGNELGYCIRMQKERIPGECAIVVKVGTEEPTPYTIARDTFVVYGSKPYQQVDVGDSILVYEVDGLSSYQNEYGYRIRLVFYFEGDKEWKEMIDIDNNKQYTEWIKPGKITEVEFDIPKECLNDGKIRITIVPKSNGAKAVLSWFNIYRYKSGGGTQSSGEGKSPLVTSFISYPDPVRERATIKFTMDRECEVSLDVYDVSGRIVKRLLNKTIDKGSHTVKCDCTSIPNGIYFYRLIAGNKTFTEKFVVLK